MKHAVETRSGTVIYTYSYMASLIKIGSAIQKLTGRGYTTDTQEGDRIEIGKQA
jgi:hypothetical protein